MIVQVLEGCDWPRMGPVARGMRSVPRSAGVGWEEVPLGLFLIRGCRGPARAPDGVRHFDPEGEALGLWSLLSKKASRL